MSISHLSKERGAHNGYDKYLIRHCRLMRYIDLSLKQRIR